MKNPEENKIGFGNIPFLDVSINVCGKLVEACNVSLHLPFFETSHVTPIFHQLM